MPSPGAPRPDCPFCRIIHAGAPARIIHEWHDALAIVPRGGDCTEDHLLALPCGHVVDFATGPVVSATVQLRAAGNGLALPWSHAAREQEPAR
ncbi:hypothetical protein [Streptomyces hygroscopicus]|uniref:hypothetical protein n=1 Tax=Streptomyces hygroscopicus TaxID=1912 RepID=UPI000767C31C|nr:hypothetical protein [Streptomyces hygroscopicus]